MGTLNVDLSELDAVIEGLGKATAEVFAMPSVAELLDVWYKIATQLAPVDSGALLAGIKVVGVSAEAGGAVGLIVSTEHYSGWVNFGTERQQAQPFFSAGAAAVHERLDYVERKIAAALEDLLAGKGVPAGLGLAA